ncbi:MAG: beta strand repeat-containing protein [Tractidigestivibacter sp.]|jgi:hypothetical protein|uniref:beta strand repeat-containing protein n=1 Tax=Tractidigestivibacter sp. TaxID=2847320 RepID=UPI003D8B4EDB
MSKKQIQPQNNSHSKFGFKARAACLAGTIALSGTLVFSTIPTAAIAETTTDVATTQTAADQTSGSAPSMPSGTAPDGGSESASGAGGGANTMTYDYSGSYSAAITADGESVSSDGETYDATETDENAALVENGGALALTGVTLTKSGDDTNGDNCNFYGLNSILLAVGEGSTATVSDMTLSATSEGSNGIFSTDSATVLANGVQINTTAGNSRGLDATYGGTILAADVDISTQGDHSGAIATDRGGGYISVVDATLSTEGSGSPLIYSTGDIEVSNVTGTASGSQIAGMEGLNTILINNSSLTSTNEGTTGSDPVANGVIIYQSTSGDAESTTGETATFQAANSTLTSSITSGSMFYLTNTTADIVLSNTTLDFDSDAADLLLAAGNDSNNWGSAGSNGATVKMTLMGEDVSGNVEADTISSATLYLTDNTTWTGATVIDENSAGSTSDAPITVNVDSTSTWVVTESCTLSNLTVADGGQVVDENGNTVTIVADGQTVVQGDSDITVTVNGTYSTDYDESGEGTLSTDLIDRSAFDEAFGTDTTWTMGGSSDTTEESTDTSTAGTDAETTSTTSTQEADTNPIVAFFQGIGTWFSSLFS